MSRFVRSIAVIAVAMIIPSGAARAGVPFINLEGVGGVAFNPIAYPATDGGDAGQLATLGPVTIAKPRVGLWYVNLHTEPNRIDWTTAGIATAINDRVEVSFGHEAIAVEGLENIHKYNVGAKALLLPENALGVKVLPAVSVGAIWKSTSFGLSPAVEKKGFDFYAVLTKLITQLPAPVLISAGALSTKGQVDGILGFNKSSREIVFFGNVDVIPVSWLAVGAEVKQGPEYSDQYEDALYWNAHAGYLASKNLTLAVAYTHAGEKKATPLGFGGGLVLGAQYAF